MKLQESLDVTSTEEPVGNLSNDITTIVFAIIISSTATLVVVMICCSMANAVRPTQRYSFHINRQNPNKIQAIKMSPDSVYLENYRIEDFSTKTEVIKLHRLAGNQTSAEHNSKDRVDFLTDSSMSNRPTCKMFEGKSPENKEATSSLDELRESCNIKPEGSDIRPQEGTVFVLINADTKTLNDNKCTENMKQALPSNSLHDDIKETISHRRKTCLQKCKENRRPFSLEWKTSHAKTTSHTRQNLHKNALKTKLCLVEVGVAKRLPFCHSDKARVVTRCVQKAYTCTDNNTTIKHSSQQQD